jgi:transposase InsO family protein
MYHHPRWQGDLKIQQTDNVNRFDVAMQQAHAAELQHGDAWRLWHARLGHVSHDNYRRLLGASDGLPQDLQRGDDLCGGCARGKQAVAPFPKAPFRGIVKATRALELIHTDLMGPMKTKSAGGAKYILLFIDDYSRYITVYLLKAKSEVPKKFKEYIDTMERRLGARIRYVRSDNGSEYVNRKFAKICLDGGIVHQRTVPYTPQQNGLAERTNRTVMEMARSMMMYREVDAEWWGYAVKCAEYLLNRMTSTVHPDATPIEICFEIVPTLDHARVFGGEGFAYVDAKQRTKLDPKAFRCMLLGYAEDGKGYRVLDLEQNKVKVVRTVVLDERELGGIYPVANVRDVSDAYMYREMQTDDGTTILPTVNTTQRPSNNDDVTMAEPEDDQDGDEDEAMPMVDREPEQHAQGDQMQLIGPVAPPTLPVPPTNTSDAIVFHPTTRRRTLSQVNTRILPSGSPVSTGRSRLMLQNRNNDGSDDRQIVVYDHNASEHESKTDSDDEPPAKRSRVNGEEGEGALSAAVHAMDVSIPSSYEEATTGSNKRQWTIAIQNEIDSLVRNQTWDVVPRGPNVKTVGTKWVFSVKKNERGDIVRYKARLVGQGFRQRFGVNFFETYAPVANMNSIRIVLAVCCARGFLIYQFDVDTAFLYGTLDEVVFMEIPDGIECDDGMMLRLNKSLYGLKQAAHVWNKTINAVLIKIGFKPSTAD